jgi:hypothetical protein
MSSNGGCATSPGFPTQNYGNIEMCVITIVPAVPLQILAFDVEFQSSCEFDAVPVNSELYRGTTGPPGVVPVDGQIF